MIKKALLLLAAALCMATGAQAATASGSWTIVPNVTVTDVNNVVDTKDRVYYLLGQSLFCYDKTTQENEALNKVNSLSDVAVDDIYYNADARYLVVAYDNSNLDVITDDGSVINLPDIKNASITQSKGINDVTFGSGVFYVATEFGYVVYNTVKWEVKESFNYSTNVVSVAQVGQWMLLSVGSTLYYGPADEHRERLSQWSTLTGNDNGHITPLTSDRFMLRTGWTMLYQIEEQSASAITTRLVTYRQHPSNAPQATPTGFVASCPGQSFYLTLGPTADALTEQPLPYDGELVSAAPSGDGTLWWLGSKGLHSSAAPDTYYLPEGIVAEYPYYLTYDPAGTTLYVSSTGTNHRVTRENYPCTVATWDGTRWADVTPTSASLGSLQGTYRPAFSTTASGVYFLPSWYNGLLKVADGQVTEVMAGGSNSPFTMVQVSADYTYCHTTVAIDAQGNLWAVQTGLAARSNVFVLPAAKHSQSTTSASDWIAVTSLPDVTGSKRAHLLPLKHNTGIKIYASGDYQGSIVFIDDGGDPTGTIRSKAYSYRSLIDQDNTTVSWNYILSLAEDQNGTVWMGTDQGVISFDPSQALGSSFTVNHIKVPRNDGTNLADYLLDGLEVNAIAVDRSNRKWLGTYGSGLFQVSADGSSVLQSFTSSDSPLLSDNICDVACDQQSGTVYVATSAGVMAYSSVTSAAATDYSQVYAYPNPVRPDYRGTITITGLMDGSLVKIADTAGNVVKQLKAENGSAEWDGTDQNYDAVKSGVYFILASRTESDSSESVVTKVLIMR